MPRGPKSEKPAEVLAPTPLTSWIESSVMPAHRGGNRHRVAAVQEGAD